MWSKGIFIPVLQLFQLQNRFNFCFSGCCFVLINKKKKSVMEMRVLISLVVFNMKHDKYHAEQNKVIKK